MSEIKCMSEQEHFTEITGEDCEACGKFVEGFEYKMCCSGHECGCMGQPMEPCVCSQECWDKLMEGKRNEKK